MRVLRGGAFSGIGETHTRHLRQPPLGGSGRRPGVRSPIPVFRVTFRHRLFGIPHYGHHARFAAFTIREIDLQSEGAIRLEPGNCLVLCSTPEA